MHATGFLIRRDVSTWSPSRSPEAIDVPPCVLRNENGADVVSELLSEVPGFEICKLQVLRFGDFSEP